MGRAISVLLVHNLALHMAQMRLLLEQAGAEICEACSFGEVMRELSDNQSIDVVLTDSIILDGDWRDVVALARRPEPAMSVILVSRSDDRRLGAQAMALGVFHVIARPSVQEDLYRAVRSARIEALIARARVNDDWAFARSGGVPA